jgi:hypothetical protein
MPKHLDDKTLSNRRAFLKGAAIAAAPVAAAGAAAAVAVDERQARLARLEAEAGVRAAHQDWLRKVNTGDRAEAARLHGAVVRLDPDHEGPPDAITLAADGLRATGRYHYVALTEVERPLDSTLAKMAAFQGEGMVRSSERRRLKADYVKTEAGWSIAGLRFEPV